jgi:hypothetical protein
MLLLPEISYKCLYIKIAWAKDDNSEADYLRRQQ